MGNIEEWRVVVVVAYRDVGQDSSVTNAAWEETWCYKPKIVDPKQDDHSIKLTHKIICRYYDQFFLFCCELIFRSGRHF